MAERSVTSQLDQLLQGRNTCWYKGRLGLLNLVVAFLCLTQANNGFDGSMMNTLQTVPAWRDYFGAPTGATLGLFNAIQTIGGIPGLLLSPYLADWQGRRRCLFFGLCIMQVGAILQTASQSVGMFIAARGLLGFGLSFAGLASPLLIGEIAYPAHRGTCTAFFGVNYSLGAIIAAWVTFGTFRIESTWSWRIPSLLQGMPALIQMLFIFFCPESPRWLINKGRDEEALKSLAYWHCDGDVDDPLVAYEYQEIKYALHMEKEAKDSTSYKAILSTKGNRKRAFAVMFIAFCSQWSGNGLVSYYLNLVLNTVGIKDAFSQTLFNGILTIVNYFWAILGAFLVDRAGRRTLFLVSTGGMCISYVVWTICSAIYAQSATNLDAQGNAIGANDSAGRGVLAFIFVYYAFYNIAFAPLLSLYTIEIVPFQLRAKYLTIGSLAINCALVFNQYANPIALVALQWRYYIVYCCWLAFEFVVLYFTIIETVGKDGPLPLEVTNFLFDGADRSARLEQHGRAAALAGPGATEGKDFEDGMLAEKTVAEEQRVENVTPK